jgi:pyruvate formate lyase activating enzyme
MAKYRRFGMEFKMDGVERPSSERMSQLKDFFSTTGLKVKIGG